MSGELSRTSNTGTFDRVFTEVHHGESLELRNFHELRLFHLNVRNYSFSTNEFIKFLKKNIGGYVFSRAKIEGFKEEGDIQGVRDEALRVMRRTGAPDSNDTGNELGELLLYIFLEEKLKAPKLLSKVELSTDAMQYKSRCDGIHMRIDSEDGGTVYCQLVFGASNVIRNLKDAIDAAFETVQRIEGNECGEIQLIEQTIFDRRVNQHEADFIRSVLIPSPDSHTHYDTAYGIFIGYTLGLSAEGRTAQEFRSKVNEKMERDIKEYAGYIRGKIAEHHLSGHSFYFYLLPMDDAEDDKKAIMDAIMGGV